MRLNKTKAVDSCSFLLILQVKIFLVAEIARTVDKIIFLFELVNTKLKLETFLKICIVKKKMHRHAYLKMQRQQLALKLESN